MMIIWIIISSCSFVLCGMQLSLILVNLQDEKPVDFWQYVWTTTLFVLGMIFFISTIGKASQL
jgi:hypothetical protein